MPGEKADSDDYGKTGTLVAAANLILTPLYFVDIRLGVSAAIAATTIFIYEAHEVGKNRRPVGNAVNQANSFFGRKTGDKSTEIDNAIQNIAVGGGALFDEAVQIVENVSKKMK